MSDCRVSVVMITHNRAAEMAHTLEHMLSLPEKPAVFVIDNGSTDDTTPLVRQRFPEVRLLTPGRNVGAAGRNLGVAASPTRYVAFADDDSWWEPGSLSRAADVLDAHPRLAVITGHIVVDPGGVDDPICEELRASPLPRPPDLPGHPLMSFLAGASMVRRSAFLAAGGFDPHLFLGGEEELLASQLASEGWALAYVPEVVVHHQPSSVRDPHLRRRQGIRNTLWFTWMRRPAFTAVRRTAEIVRRLPFDPVTVHALIEAAAGLPWALRHRSRVPPEVESAYRLLDRAQLESRARRYVS